MKVKAFAKAFEIPQRATYKLGRMRSAMASLGHPERGRKTVLVAGTNGKGSTVSVLSDLFVRHGWKVGTYLSPHVVARTERILIDQKPVSERSLRAYEKKYARVLEPLSYFERLTTLAFLIFKDAGVDLQMLEVGIGGRLDATNICHPDLSIITPIDYDHADVLGDKIEAIAAEKAGIMRRGKWVFSQPQSTKVKHELIKQARLKKTLPIIFSGKTSALRPWKKALQEVGATFGEHQRKNFGLVLEVWNKLADLWKIDSNPDSILQALQSPRLPPARMQILRKTPLWIIDGAHNEHATDALTAFLKAKAPNKKWKIYFGVMREKNPQKILRRLRPLTNSLVLPHFYPERSLDPHQLQKVAQKIIPDVCVLPAGEAALLKALAQDWKWGAQPVLISGSFYLAGEVLKVLQKAGKISR